MEDFVSATWLRRLLTIVLLGGIVLLGVRVMSPFIVPLLWAGILAFLTWPAYRWLHARCGGRTTLAALLMSTAVGLAVIVPVAWLAVATRIELTIAYHRAQDMLAAGVQLPPQLARIPWLGEHLRELAAQAAQDPNALGLELRRLSDQSSEQIAHVLGDIGRNLVKLLVSVLSLFFIYRGGGGLGVQIAQGLEQVLGPRAHDYLLAIRQTVRAVLYGLVFAAFVQGVLVGIGYWAAGVGSPVFLAALTTVGGLIPFAAPVIWGAVVLWLVLSGHTVAGIGLLVWGGIVLGSIDHLVRPLLISREAKIPFLLVLFGVLGGLAAFGLVGLFIGPVILAVLLAIWREWLHEYQQPQS